MPPEIEFLEISEGEDLTEIAALVRDKLERFKQTLPAKYIEQLRASKTKTAKKPGRETDSGDRYRANQAGNCSGKRRKNKRRATRAEFNRAETEKTEAEITATKENLTAQPAPVAAVPKRQSQATNNVQPSLF